MSSLVFHVGPQKTGTSWIFKAMQEHPQVSTSQKDSIHYFDMNLHRGDEWYKNQFIENKQALVRFDPTFTYLRSYQAPRLIHDHNPNAKIIVSLRDPVERAFSHYWHEKKKGRYNFSFEEVFTNYDLFTSWVELGFYAEHISRYLEYFPKEQILCQQFSDFKDRPVEVIKELYAFCNIDDSFMPSVINQKINPARPKRNRLTNQLRQLEKRNLPIISKLARKLDGLLLNQSEYGKGINPDTARKLQELFEPETQRLEKLLDINLAAWRKYD